MADASSPASSSSVRLTTLDDCGLAIGRYPRFRYDARGGGGIALAPPAAVPAAGPWPLHFDPALLRIPDLSWRTTRILGVPIPPGVRIGIEPLELDGQLDPASGAVDLHFRARFHCSLAGLYRPPALQVNTLLSTGEVRGERHRGQGAPLGADGQALLVGVARVPASGDAVLDAFLGLPDDALAVLRCHIALQPGPRA
ncbi:putative protein [Cyanobium sp. PCC 7001]|uniref:hypothetical protein n=1 Tax=Cyanobium sp. PCC 7001 TaxID=180281 RepID=UPI0001805168|nr:hypothetical protein [Cyanobium sp. PCC 7001]EDY37944.1 putative protein [Cyanobium sp. PCC 7001]